WLNAGRPLTAVSGFIARQMYLQWGFQTDRVIENGVDTDEFCPSELKCPSACPVIVHGVNDKGNLNKGWDHIELLQKEVDAEVLSLDEMMWRWKFHGQTKAKTLAGATLCVHPSGYEGNSMFVAEALACGVPVIGYDVGYLYTVKDSLPGTVIDRRDRSPKTTLEVVQRVIN